MTPMLPKYYVTKAELDLFRLGYGDEFVDKHCVLTEPLPTTGHPTYEANSTDT